MRGQPSFQMYYIRIVDEVRRRLSQEDADTLRRVDFDEYLDYLYDQYEWQPLEYDTSQMTAEPLIAKQQVLTVSGNVALNEPRLRLRIPVAPHPQRTDFFRFQPNFFGTTAEPQWQFRGDMLIIETAQSQQAVDRMIAEIHKWIGTRNREIEEGNAKLRPQIQAAWQERRRQVEVQHAATQKTLEGLTVRLYQDPQAPIKPVEFKRRQLRTAPPHPREDVKPEPSLRHEDILELVDFIDQYARQFEVTPAAYADRDEEQLRDLLIGMMNVNYPGAATGETFSKLGKTDISFKVRDDTPLIAECKFWSGAQAYGDALHQLFRYLTWRQTYGILIHFCRRRDMSSAIAAAKERMALDSTYVSGSLAQRSETRFVTRHTHPQDNVRLVEVHHLFYDLSVEQAGKAPKRKRPPA